MTDNERFEKRDGGERKAVGEEKLTDGQGALPRLSEEGDEETADAQPEKGGGTRGG